MEWFKNRKVLVTGGLGFIGLNLVRKLLKYGSQVRIIDKTVPPLALNWLHGFENHRSVEVIQADIRSRSQMQQVLTEVEVVFNLAGKSGASKSLVEAQLDLQVNIDGHLNLLLTDRISSPIRRITV